MIEVDQDEQRRLAHELVAQLAQVFDDPIERAAVDDELAAALALAPEQGHARLRAVLRARPQSRTWMALRTPDVPDPDRIMELPGLHTAPLGVLFVCPQGDWDYVRDSVGDVVPLCPTHKVALIRPDE